MIVNSRHIGWWAETEEPQTKPVVLMRKDSAKLWGAELVRANLHDVVVKIYMKNVKSPHHFFKRIDIPPTKSRAGRHIEGFGNHDAGDVSEAIAMDSIQDLLAAMDD